MVAPLKFVEIHRRFVLQNLIRNESRNNIDPEVEETSMTVVLKHRLRFQCLDHRFNNDPLFH